MQISIQKLLRACQRFALMTSLVALVGQTSSANNVQVALEGALLKVSGDSAANDILIVQNAARDIVIRGRNGTTVNRLPEVRFRGVNLNATEILMGAGNDSVSISGLTTGNDLFVNLGAGNDRFATANPVIVGGNLTIEGAANNDVILVRTVTVMEDIYIDGGTGTLRADVTGSNGGKSLTVIGDLLADTINVLDSVFLQDIAIETKTGNDRVTIDTVASLLLAINTDEGADIISVTDYVAEEDIGIFTGKQNDSLRLLNVSSGKSITVSVDTGDDFVSGIAVSANEDAVFEGGDGFDQLEDFGIVGGQKKEIKEFERITP